MAILVGLPVLAITVILQSTVFSRVTLLNGTVDLVLIVVLSWALHERVKDEWVWAVIAGAMFGFVSALPLWTPILGYLMVTGIGLYLKRRVWQIPVLALLISVFFGTLLVQLLSLGVLTIVQGNVPISTAFNIIILPSLLLNLLAALPINAVVNEIAGFLYVDEVEA